MTQAGAGRPPQGALLISGRRHPYRLRKAAGYARRRAVGRLPRTESIFLSEKVSSQSPITHCNHTNFLERILRKAQASLRKVAATPKPLNKFLSQSGVVVLYL